MDRIFTVTVSDCICCGKCELACAFAHARNGVPAETRIDIIRRGVEAGTPVVCFQCDDAACVTVCPSGALARNEATGAIDLDDARCIGCRMCVPACPFGNMQFDAKFQIVQKCDLCGGNPACVPFCPTKAIDYKPVQEVLGQSLKRTG